MLVGYTTDIRGALEGRARPQVRRPATSSDAEEAVAGLGKEEEDDLCGRPRFVLMNEDSGEIVSELDRSARACEYSSLGEKGHEGGLVVVEIRGYTR